MAMIETSISIAIDGTVIEGLLHAWIDTTNHFSSDSFGLTFAMGAQPLGDLLYWSSLLSGYVELTVKTPNGDTRSLITGMIDNLSIDPIRGTAAIEGRDLSSLLIDCYREQDFINQTASEVVATLASFHGLTPNVSPTYGSVGRYYSDGYTKLSLGQFSRIRSDWDLVVQLARENNFDVFVQGGALFFLPATGLTTVPLRLRASNVQKLTFQKALTIFNKPSVRVQSWNSQHMTSYDSAGGDGTDPSILDGSSQSFLFSGSNFTSQQVFDTAQQFANEISRLAGGLHLEMPWDLAFMPRTILSFDETGSTIDGLYRVEQVERHFSSTSGSSQIVRAAML